jgi:hypothetical protein
MVNSVKTDERNATQRQPNSSTNVWFQKTTNTIRKINIIAAAAVAFLNNAGTN